MFDKLKKKIHRRNWPEVSAEVMSCDYQNAEKAFAEAPFEPPFYTVAFDYVVNGQTYTGGLLSEVEVQKGDKFPIRYDPKNPGHNSSDPLPNWMMIYDASFFGAISAGILWYWLHH